MSCIHKREIIGTFSESKNIWSNNCEKQNNFSKCFQLVTEVTINSVYFPLVLCLFTTTFIVSPNYLEAKEFEYLNVGQFGLYFVNVCEMVG